MMGDHEHDEDGNCIYLSELPAWRFSLWDMTGIALQVAGGVFSVVSQGFHLAARESAAMANYRRQNYDLRQAQKAREAQQRAMSNDLRALIEGSGTDDA